MKNRVLKIFIAFIIPFVMQTNVFAYDTVFEEFDIMNSQFQQFDKSRTQSNVKSENKTESKADKKTNKKEEKKTAFFKTKKKVKSTDEKVINNTSINTDMADDNNENAVNSEDDNTGNNNITNSDEKELTPPANTTDIEVYSDSLEYFPERNEFEAVGKARMYIPKDDANLYADKLIFNRNTNIIKGYGDVKIVSKGSTAEGDFVQINLNEDNALLQHSSVDEFNVKIVSEKTNVYPGKLVAEKGTATSDENYDFKVGATTFGNFNTPYYDRLQKQQGYMKEKYNNEYVIKARVIEINSLKEHDQIVLKNADIYLKNIKIASAPTLKFVTNKEQQYVEANTPEVSFLKQFGLFFGPGYVFNMPKGTTLKVAPVILTSNSKWGVGGIGRFRSATNVTEAAWGTVKKEFILRGSQKLMDDVSLEYGYNGYFNEWFFGDRIPGKVVQVVYQKLFPFEKIEGSYEHRFTAGFVGDAHRSWTTGRYRYQGRFSQSLYNKCNFDDRTGINIGYSVEGAATLYGNGQTQGMFRVGPYVRTEYKNWIQQVSYGVGAMHGDSPMFFDKYMYGKQNISLIEMLKLNKYISVAYSASLALLEDNWENEMLQENRFFLILGPEDAKINLGYDTVRQRSIMNFQFAIGTENAKVDFKKLVVHDPENLGKDNKKPENPNSAINKLKNFMFPDGLESDKKKKQDDNTKNL